MYLKNWSSYLSRKIKMAWIIKNIFGFCIFTYLATSEQSASLDYILNLCICDVNVNFKPNMLYLDLKKLSHNLFLFNCAINFFIIFIHPIMYLLQHEKICVFFWMPDILVDRKNDLLLNINLNSTQTISLWNLISNQSHDLI